MRYKTMLAFLAPLVVASSLASAGDHDCFSPRNGCSKPLTQDSKCQRGTDYYTSFYTNTQGNVTFFAIHGGDIEYNTDVLAGRLAGIFSSNFYAFVARPASDSKCIQNRSVSDALSIRATEFNDRDLLDLLKDSKYSVMIGGYADSRLPPPDSDGNRDEELVCVGGKDADTFVDKLNSVVNPQSTGSGGYVTMAAPTPTPGRFARLVVATARQYSDAGEGCNGLGAAPDSVVNQNARKAGLQLYFSRAMRKQMAEGNTREAEHFFGLIVQALEKTFKL